MDPAISCLEDKLPADIGSAMSARRLIARAAGRWRLAPSTAEDAALVASELVTNAVIHAGTPVVVRVRLLGQGVRIEVEDGDDRLPLVSAESPEDLLETRSMTGRGLALVAALSDRWSAEPADGGRKVVWAEVGTGQRRLGSVPLARDAPGGTRVRLIGVPVRVLVESVRQFADWQREALVAGIGLAPGSQAQALAEASRQVSAAIEGMGWPTTAVAEAARARGEDLVDVEVMVRPGAVSSLDRVLARFRGLAESVVRGQWLTLPPSDEVAAYREWLRQEVLSQLAGKAPRPFRYQ